MRPRRALLFYFVAGGLLLLAGTTTRAIDHFADDLEECLNRITGHIYNDQFNLAENLIDSLDRSRYNGPMVYLFRAILYQARMMNAESDFLEKEFFSVLDTLEGRCGQSLDGGGDSALAYFCLGHMHAFRSLFHARAGRTWAAIKGGLKARNAYKRGYRADPVFHDIALGLGSYQYWKTVKTRLINWTPLFKREKDEGIELLRLAIDSSEVSSDAARTSLIWIYINERLFGEAIRLADYMRRKYPCGLTFHWALGEAVRKIGDDRLAAEIYTELLEQLKDNPGNYYNMVEAAYFLSEHYRNLYKKSLVYFDSLAAIQQEIKSYPIPEETRKRQKKKIDKILKPAD